MTKTHLNRVIQKLRHDFAVETWNRDTETFSALALEAIETPPSPIRVAMLLAICGLFFASVTMAWFCHVDIHAVVQGKIQAVGRSKVVQSFDQGQVAQILVANGSHVVRGSALVLLDSAEALADQQEHATANDEFRAEIIRRRTAIAVVQNRRLNETPSIVFDATIEHSVQAREQSVLVADLNALKASIATLESKRIESTTQRESLTQTIVSEEALVQTLTQRYNMRLSLEQQQWETLANVLDAREALDREKTNVVDHQGQLRQAAANASSVIRQEEEAIAKFISDNRNAIATVETKLDAGTEELLKAKEKAGRTKIIASIDGTVQELAVTTLGQVVGRGQQLMTIVPDSKSIEIEALISNRDIGFIHSGQKAVIKVDTYPYTIFGTIPGVVTTVSTDAVYGGDLHQALPSAAEAAQENETTNSNATAATPRTQDFVFPVTIVPTKSTIQVGADNVFLSPGMTVEAEILTGRRRLIDYVLSPLREIGSEAFRER